VGGGPLHDLGIYCLNAVRQLFDAEPEEAFAWKATRKEPRFADSYEMLSAMLRFPKERLATFTASNGAADAGWYELVGTKGSICLGPAYEYAGELEMEVTIGGRSRTTKFARRDQFAPELLHFSDSILERRQPEPSGREGLADVRVIAALLESAERGRPVRLPPYEAASGPGMDQEMRLPPVRKPDLVEVQQPHPS
ncbi:MAG TPA: Gfo/Idh/MocA family oxidoreductase, partial [Solirubrobacterales bacterium]|nr:Gfo/Idh/MocA family oxidoreductase [Solirubrobacterales bacterium]